MGFFDDVLDVLTGGHIRRTAERAASAAANLQRAQKRDVLKTEITSDQTISDVTRSELLAQLAGTSVTDDGAFASISGNFSAAKEGDNPKFKARQATEKFLEITADRPGQRQTRFVDSVRGVGEIR